MKLKEFEEKVKEIFGIDFFEWYIEVFVPHADARTRRRIRRRMPLAYKLMKQFLEPLIVTYKSQIHISRKELEKMMDVEPSWKSDVPYAEGWVDAIKEVLEKGKKNE